MHVCSMCIRVRVCRHVHVLIMEMYNSGMVMQTNKTSCLSKCKPYKHNTWPLHSIKIIINSLLWVRLNHKTLLFWVTVHIVWQLTIGCSHGYNYAHYEHAKNKPAWLLKLVPVGQPYFFPCRRNAPAIVIQDKIQIWLHQPVKGYS